VDGGEEVIAECLAVTAVDDKSCIILDFRPANDSLHGFVHKLIGKDKGDRNKIKFRKVLNELHFNNGKIVHIVCNFQRKYFVKPYCAEHLGISTKPPALSHEGGNNLSFYGPPYVVVAECPFPREVGFK